MLRRSLWVVAAALFVASLAVPQASAQNIKLGVKGGVNFADVGGDDVSDTKNKTGFIAGGFAEFMIGNMFAVQPEVLYSQKGFKIDDPDVDGKLKLDYFEVPVLLKINVPIEGSKVHPSFYAGPAVSIKSSCKLQGEESGVSFDIDCDSPLIVDFIGEELPIKSTDFGIVFGGGISFDVGGAEVGVDVRYNLGLTKVVDTDPQIDAKNRVISIMGTVGFPVTR